MNEERLSRHITQENLKLKSENSHLKSQMEAKEIMLDNKDDEIVRLLNQIASDMVKRSDVDEIVRNAVAEEHDRLVDYYEGKMKSMAAEYEAKIADLQKSKSAIPPMVTLVVQGLAVSVRAIHKLLTPRKMLWLLLMLPRKS